VSILTRQKGKDNLPPESPPLAAYAVSKTRRGAAAHHIRSECERFCCETLKAIFLGEGTLALQGSLEMDAQNMRLGSHGNLTPLSNDIGGGYLLDHGDGHVGLSSSTSSAETLAATNGLVRSYWEMWDYQGGCRFRGFVAEGEHQTGMFIFFDEKAFGHGLKAGYVLDMHEFYSY
jgi:hypothetical protein